MPELKDPTSLHACCHVCSELVRCDMRHDGVHYRRHLDERGIWCYTGRGLVPEGTPVIGSVPPRPPKPAKTATTPQKKSPTRQVKTTTSKKRDLPKCHLCKQTVQRGNNGRLVRHKAEPASKRTCRGTGKLPATGDPDLDWMRYRPDPSATISKADVRAAIRILRKYRQTEFAGASPVEIADLQRWLDRVRTIRPDHFPIRRSKPAPTYAAASPERSLNKPRTDPKKTVFYREVLVGKTN